MQAAQLPEDGLLNSSPECSQCIQELDKVDTMQAGINGREACLTQTDKEGAH